MKDNLAASNPTATLEQIIEATKTAGADEFMVGTLGLDTKLEENDQTYPVVKNNGYRLPGLF